MNYNLFLVTCAFIKLFSTQNNVKYTRFYTNKYSHISNRRPPKNYYERNILCFNSVTPVSNHKAKNIMKKKQDTLKNNETKRDV